MGDVFGFNVCLYYMNLERTILVLKEVREDKVIRCITFYLQRHLDKVITSKYLRELIENKKYLDYSDDLPIWPIWYYDDLNLYYKFNI